MQLYCRDNRMGTPDSLESRGWLRSARYPAKLIGLCGRISRAEAGGCAPSQCRGNVVLSSWPTPPRAVSHIHVRRTVERHAGCQTVTNPTRNKNVSRGTVSSGFDPHRPVDS